MGILFDSSAAESSPSHPVRANFALLRHPSTVYSLSATMLKLNLVALLACAMLAFLNGANAQSCMCDTEITDAAMSTDDLIMDLQDELTGQIEDLKWLVSS